MTSNPNNEFAELLRKAFERSGLSIRQLSLRSGIAYAACHGLVHAERDITLATASRIADTLGLTLSPVRRRTKKGR